MIRQTRQSLALLLERKKKGKAITETQESVMEDVNVVLYHSISCLGIEGVSLRLSIATSKSEKSTAADDRHLPNLREYCISAQNTEITAVIFALHESEIHHHQQGNFLLRRLCIYSLGSSYKLGAGFGSHS